MPTTGTMNSNKRLTRSVRDRKIGGVCGGLAGYLGLDPSLVRLGYVLLSLCVAAFPGLIVYVAACFIIPEETNNPS